LCSAETTRFEECPDNPELVLPDVTPLRANGRASTKARDMERSQRIRNKNLYLSTIVRLGVPVSADPGIYLTPLVRVVKDSDMEMIGGGAQSVNDAERILERVYIAIGLFWIGWNNWTQKVRGSAGRSRAWERPARRMIIGCGCMTI
jgi:hypothetical protein